MPPLKMTIKQASSGSCGSRFPEAGGSWCPEAGGGWCLEGGDIRRLVVAGMPPLLWLG